MDRHDGANFVIHDPGLDLVAAGKCYLLNRLSRSFGMLGLVLFMPGESYM